MPEEAYSPKAYCVPEFTVPLALLLLANEVHVFDAEQYFGVELERLNSTSPLKHALGSDSCATKL